MKRILGIALLFFLPVLCSSCSSSPKLPLLAPDAVVLAFGDSLTYGIGAKPEESYPSVLSSLIGRRVVNAGIPGEQTSGGLSRLPAALDAHNPSLVILCLGGNDFLRRSKAEPIKANLEKMILLLKSRGIPLVLIAVPDLGIPGFLSDAELYAELAEQHEVVLVEGELSRLESRNKYKSDTIHLNAEGYRLLAEHIAKVLDRAGAV